MCTKYTCIHICWAVGSDQAHELTFSTLTDRFWIKCNILQHTGCNTPQHTTTYCHILQHSQAKDGCWKFVLKSVAFCCTSLQRVAMCSSHWHLYTMAQVGHTGLVLQCVAACFIMIKYLWCCVRVLHCVALCHHVLHCDAVRCSVLQYVAVCCTGILPYITRLGMHTVRYMYYAGTMYAGMRMLIFRPGSFFGK